MISKVQEFIVGVLITLIPVAAITVLVLIINYLSFWIMVVPISVFIVCEIGRFYLDKYPKGRISKIIKYKCIK